MAKQSLLLVAQIAPPSSLVAARRVAAQCKYLGRAGWEVTVLTSRASGEGAIEGAADVVRTNDALTSALNWRRGQFDALSGSSPENYKPPSRLASIVVPDLSLGAWLPFALPTALRLARERRFDAVLTSSPPPSTHFVGFALRRRGVPWVAELRDGWTFEPPHSPWPLRLQQVVDGGVERRVLRRADAVVAVTQPIVEDARARLCVRAELVTNGYDPEDEVGAAPELLSPERHSFVHTGRLSLAGVSVRPLLDAVLLAREELADRVELVFAGSVTEEERGMLTAGDLDGIARFAGWLDRPQTIALQRSADTLLVVTAGAARRSVATGKLFEYLAARRPILVLGDETEAARIVAETGSGIAISATDPTAIAAALRRVVDDPLPKPAAEGAAAYSYPGVAERLAAVLESVAGTGR
jgi:glycosyltransferase involved in cell wall biosynthesis